MDEVAVMREKTERNKRVQARYDKMSAGGKHGHYETMFKIVREEVEAERERCNEEIDRLRADLRENQEDRGQNERLRDLVLMLIDNDPDEPIAYNGMTVLDDWRKRARKELGIPF
jgi:hypothetical protein